MLISLINLVFSPRKSVDKPNVCYFSSKGKYSTCINQVEVNMSPISCSCCSVSADGCIGNCSAVKPLWFIKVNVVFAAYCVALKWPQKVQICFNAEFIQQWTI